MTDYTQVALGFSEFVGQLLSETFEATINAQQYQLGRYAEMDAMVSLPDVEFLLRYVDPQLIIDRELIIAGAPIARQMDVPVARQALILQLTEEYEEQSVIFKNRLTNYGFDALRAVIDAMVVREQKSQISALLARMEQARLVVDSGEITAKLELTSVFQTQTTDTATTDATAKTAVKSTLTKTPLTADALLTATPDKGTLALSTASLYDGIKTLEDPVTKETTLLFDKEVLDKAVNTGADAPVRITAKPIASSATSSVFSEVTIRFKTI